MNSKTIVEKYNGKLPEETRRFADYDKILLDTKFKSIDKKFDKKAVIHWWMNVYRPENDGSIKQEVYRSWCYQNAFEYVMAGGGYIRSINQSGVEIRTIRDDKLQPQLDELLMWLPHIKFIEEKESAPFKIISIFESTLGEHGIYELKYYRENLIQLTKTTWGHETTIQTFNSLAEAIDYIRIRHYYKEKKNDSY